MVWASEDEMGGWEGFLGKKTSELDFRRMQDFTEKQKMRNKKTLEADRVEVSTIKSMKLVLCTQKDRHVNVVGASISWRGSCSIFLQRHAVSGTKEVSLGWELWRVENELSSVPWSSIRVPQGVLGSILEKFQQ